MDLVPSLGEEEFNMIQVALYQRMAMFIKASTPACTEAALRAFEETTTCLRILSHLNISQSLLLPALHNGMLIHTGTCCIDIMCNREGAVAEKCAAARQLLTEGSLAM